MVHRQAVIGQADQGRPGQGGQQSGQGQRFGRTEGQSAGKTDSGCDEPVDGDGLWGEERQSRNQEGGIGVGGAKLVVRELSNRGQAARPVYLAFVLREQFAGPVPQYAEVLARRPARVREVGSRLCSGQRQVAQGFRERRRILLGQARKPCPG